MANTSHAKDQRDARPPRAAEGGPRRGGCIGCAIRDSISYKTWFTNPDEPGGVQSEKGALRETANRRIDPKLTVSFRTQRTVLEKFRFTRPTSSADWSQNDQLSLQLKEISSTRSFI